MTANPLYLGCLMIKNGDADGQVAGALNTTGNVLRAAFQVVKTKARNQLRKRSIRDVAARRISSLRRGRNTCVCRLRGYPDPDAAQLAEIALSAADTARDIAGITPRIALLSFSTKGSAKHERVERK